MSHFLWFTVYNYVLSIGTKIGDLE